ncbi:MAG: WG repeat-containing protein [Bacteroidetes bacterium]|nr:MAG: WG repeat-containing protein [Bacteroidota bacterium]
MNKLIPSLGVTALLVASLAAQDRLYWVQLDEKVGYIDGNGQVVVPLEYDYARVQKDDLVCMLSGERWGCFSSEGRQLVPFQYEEMGHPHEGRISVMLDGKWGYIDYQGTLVLPAQYERAYDFVDGRATVRLEEQWGIIDLDGRYQATDYKLEPIGEGWYRGYFSNSNKEKRYYLVNSQLERVSEELFSNIRKFKSGFAIAEYPDGREVLLTSKGKIVEVNRPYTYQRYGNSADYMVVFDTVDTREVVLDAQDKSLYTAFAAIQTNYPGKHQFAAVINREGQEVVPCRLRGRYTIIRENNWLFTGADYSHRLGDEGKDPELFRRLNGASLFDLNTGQLLLDNKASIVPTQDLQYLIVYESESNTSDIVICDKNMQPLATYHQYKTINYKGGGWFSGYIWETKKQVFFHIESKKSFTLENAGVVMRLENGNWMVEIKKYAEGKNKYGILSSSGNWLLKPSYDFMGGVGSVLVF